MSRYDYLLEPYRGRDSRHICPQCKSRDMTFVRYICLENGRYIDPIVGRCNRESKCGYHYSPKQYFIDRNISREYTRKVDSNAHYAPITAIFHKDYISADVFSATQAGYHGNTFVQYLTSLFGQVNTSELIRKYSIGTSKYWAGATVFWQIDMAGKIRTGKIMLYDASTGKRIKKPFNHITWVHSVLKLPNYSLKQCLFGEHLLKGNGMPVAIVESEKTAVIASVYLPEFVWVAVGSLSNLNAEKCSVLKGRDVVLFPDLNGYKKWNTKARELDGITSMAVSDLLERKALPNEREQGMDIADFLIRYDYRKFH